MTRPKPILAEVRTLPVANLRDIAAMLRGLANSIDNGQECPRRVLCVLEEPEGVSIYQFGDCDIMGDIGLLDVAKLRLTNSVPSVE